MLESIIAEIDAEIARLTRPVFLSVRLGESKSFRIGASERLAK
jgi:hypothetical protein